MPGRVITIKRSGRWKICDAEIVYNEEERVLEACDPYGCSTVESGSPLAILPAPPILRPFTITPVVYVEFERRVFLEKGDEVWVTVPLDLEITRKGRPIVRLATTKAKYRLVGSLVEGIIARNARSAVYREIPSDGRECVALLKIRVNKGSDAIEGVPFNASNTMIFLGPEGRVFFSLVTAVITPATIDTRTTREPPVEGLKPVRSPPYGYPGRITTLTQTAVTVERGWRLWPYLKS